MMKNISLWLTLVWLSLACAPDPEEKDYLVFSGEIDHPKGDSIIIHHPAYLVAATLALDSGNRFADTLRLEAGYYHLTHGDESTTLYLAPGRNVSVTLDTREFDESLRYHGPGAPENTYLAEKFLLSESRGEKTGPVALARLEETAFLQRLDSLYAAYDSLLDRYRPQLNPEFVQLERQQLKYGRLEMIARYEDLKKYITQNPEFRVSESFPHVYDSLDMNNGRLAVVPNYISLLESYLMQEFEQHYQQGRDPITQYVDFIQQKVPNDSLREQLAAMVIDYLTITHELDSVYRQLQSLLHDRLLARALETTYRKFDKIKPGNPSPGFAFASLAGDTVSLADLQGRLVYIDVWATWCAPCIEEIPHLTKLQEALQTEPITFVSICVDDEWEAWEKFVREKELGGIQLFAPTLNHPFFTSYMISGIPHFILLDSEGMIIEASAARPSNPELAGKLKNLVKSL